MPLYGDSQATPSSIKLQKHLCIFRKHLCKRYNMYNDYYVMSMCICVMRVSEYCFTSFSAQSWQYRDRRKPCSYRMTSRVPVHAQYHRQHCTLWTVWSTVYAQPRWQTFDPTKIRTQNLWVSSHNRSEWSIWPAKCGANRSALRSQNEVSAYL